MLTHQPYTSRPPTSPASHQRSPHLHPTLTPAGMQAADIVRIMGIGRNEYIAIMVQVRLAFGVPFLVKKDSPAR